ncbi:hypothetical protein MRB53_011987 [Persea americana]|uniref:Uncharacterized protein n=1 Tax=Persea americana TaxID=3435 RepID=A0ACC2LWC7_PERAE|nr:hypothetical protein MRB53_011987 [Persea americana]
MSLLSPLTAPIPQTSRTSSTSPRRSATAMIWAPLSARPSPSATLKPSSTTSAPSPAPVRCATPTIRISSSPLTTSDPFHISLAISNSDDLGLFVRKAFASSHLETLLHHLRSFARSHESQIEEVCRAHYQDFILAVDDLRSLLSDVDSLKSSLSSSNSVLQSIASLLPRRC